MLVLSRKKNESIIIQDQITVTVIEIRGDKVKLGIEAPKNISVHRREVFEAIQAQLGSIDPPPPPAAPGAPTDTERSDLPHGFGSAPRPLSPDRGGNGSASF